MKSRPFDLLMDRCSLDHVDCDLCGKKDICVRWCSAKGTKIGQVHSVDQLQYRLKRYENYLTLRDKKNLISVDKKGVLC